jgi:lysophospholipase L1-like esterase
MDGGGNDVLINNRQCLAAGSDKVAGCQQIAMNSMATLKKMWASMAAAGVTDVVMFWYPHTPPATGGNDISDYAYALLVAAAQSVTTPTFRVYTVDTVPAFDGHMEYFASDNIHANATGEGVIADLLWKTMKDNCIAQATGNACCMP